MPTIGPGGDVHKRFFLLAGLVRHEYWLHSLQAENFDFYADPDTLTLRAKAHQDGDPPCVMTITEEDLLGDLHSLARAFLKEHCKGHGTLLQIAKRLKRRTTR